MLSPKKLALVLSGGGARGAYEAGVLHYIRTQLPSEISKKRPFDILCGSSVGAINTCFLASTSHDLDYQGNKLHDLWASLTQEKVYRRGFGSLTKLALRTFFGVTRNFLTRKNKSEKKVHFKGLMDTRPFTHFLKENISWKQIALNIQNKIIGAISLTATNVHSGRLELFIDKHPSYQYAGRQLAHFGLIEAEHALASSSIPFLFPSISLRGYHYTDGSMRSNTPLSPAIQMGAEKVLVIGLHHASERAELQELPQKGFGLMPTLGELLGTVSKSVFVDRLDYDIAQLERINAIIKAGRDVYGSDFLEQLNLHWAEQSIRKDIAARGLKEVQVTSIHPSQDIRQIFSEKVVQTGLLERELSLFEKSLLKVLDVDIHHGLDFLTFILFIPEYLRSLLELGFQDARSNHEALVKFFTD